jgi:aryl-alcohol dehydrogenase-like predicted oxidoreductase
MSFGLRTLGRTGLKAGPLGVASSYGAPAHAFEEAFDRGCNYFYWGSLRTRQMREAIKNICRSGKRDELIIVVQSYSRSASLMEIFLKKALRDLRMDRADILLLGWYDNPPAQRILDLALELRARGLFKFLALSSHNRSIFPKLAKEGIYELFHVRYNAAHRGAESEVFPHIAAIPAEMRPGIVTYTATRWGDLLHPGKMPPGRTPPLARDCYRFVLSNPSVDVCMCGPKDIGQMREALEALRLGPLTSEELDRMRMIGDHVHRHPKKFIW